MSMEDAGIVGKRLAASAIILSSGVFVVLLLYGISLIKWW